MEFWKSELSELKVKNKAKYQKLFSQLVSRVQNNKLLINPGIKEYKEHYVITEEDRLNSYFIHIVPKEAFYIFKEMIKQPDIFLGFSVLAGKHNNKDIRISCFGVQCNLLGKALIDSKKRKQSL